MENGMTALCRLEDIHSRVDDLAGYIDPADIRRLTLLLEDIKGHVSTTFPLVVDAPKQESLPTQKNYNEMENAVSVITGETSSEYWVIRRVRKTASNVQAAGFTIEDLRLFYRQRTKSSTLLNLVGDLNRWRADKNLTRTTLRFTTQADLNSGKRNQFVA